MRIRARLIVKNYELEERRKKLGYTQADFAEAIGIPVLTYQLIESLKKKPTEEQATSISLELKAPKDVLFPNGYERIVDVFNPRFERIADFTPPLLGFDEERLLETADAKLTVTKLMGKLNPREKNLIEFRYGLNSQEPKTLEETAKYLGVTRERIRQMEAKAHEKMRHI